MQYRPTSRWKRAQEAEKQFWQSSRSDTRVRSRKWSQNIRKETHQLIGWIQRISKKDVSDSKILQIGAACDGFINFIDADCYAIDPLANFYLNRYRDLIPSDIDYRVGISEKLPWKEEFFDIILIHNCLDHTLNPSATLNESFRTLKKDGILYVGIHIFSLLGYLVTRPKENILWMIDPAHPHIFTWPLLVKNLVSSGFRIISYNIPPHYIQERKRLPNSLSKLYSEIARERFVKVLAKKSIS